MPISFAVGHRVVHGGPNYAKPVLVDPTCCDELDALEPLAPLHQPHNLLPIRDHPPNGGPELPQVACFDTAFHRPRRGSRRHSRCRAGNTDAGCTPLRLSRPVL